MKTLLSILVVFGFVTLLIVRCPNPPTRTEAGVPDTASPDAAPTTRPIFTIRNECGFDIWIQQQNMPAGTPSVVKFASRTAKTYDIPLRGLPSTRFWAKTGCDHVGQNCQVGQSSPPCPSAGCAPPIDSKFEATWGCDLSEPDCGMTPQGKTLHGPTFWNSSAVDGYTLPYNVEVGADGGAGCTPVNCAELTQSLCPTKENLSTDGKYPMLNSVDLAAVPPKGDGGVPLAVGCFSPCEALTYPSYGGMGYQPASNEHAEWYCCPTPPISSPDCRKGPVTKTRYVASVHAMCHRTAYAFAYDDGIGGRTCNVNTKITMTYCPPVPLR